MGDRSVSLNAGTIASVGGWIASKLTNTGTITVTTGVLSLESGGTLDGTIDGAGTLALGSGVFTGSALNTLVSTTLLMAGGTFVVTHDSTIANLAIDSGGDEITVSSGDTLTTENLSIQTDSTSNYDVVISGSGTLDTTGTTLLATLASLPGAGIGVQTWLNSGIVTVSGTVVVAGTWVNTAGGVFAFSDNAHGINAYGSISSFNNAGLLEKTIGPGTVSLDSALQNTGTITIASGTLALYGGGNLDGTINGAGTLALDGGNFAGSGLDTLPSTAILLNGGTFDVTTNANVSQMTISSSLPSTSTIVVSAGDTLTIHSLSENNDYYPDGPNIEGPGTLTTTGISLFQAIDYPIVEYYLPTYLGGGLTWLNEGTASVFKFIYIESNESTNAVHIVNAAGAVFDFSADHACIYDDTAKSTFSNAGLLEKSAGTGTSDLYSALTNTGTLTATTGTLALHGGAELDGQVGGTAGGQVLLVGGTFATAGTGSVADDGATAGLVVGSGQTWSVSGTVLDSGIVQLDGTMALAIGASGVWAFSGAVGAIAGSGTAGVSNAGTIQKTSGALSSIGTAVTNTGLIDAGFGTLQLLGTVTGTGTMRVEAASTLELGDSLDRGQTLSFDGSGATLKLDAPTSIAQPLQGFGAGDRIDLAGITLTSASVAGSSLTLDAGATRFIFHSSSSLSGLSVQLTADGGGGTVATLSGAPPGATLDSDVTGLGDIAGLMFASLQMPTVTMADSRSAAANTLEMPGGMHLGTTFVPSTHDFSGTLFASVPGH